MLSSLATSAQTFASYQVPDYSYDNSAQHQYYYDMYQSLQANDTLDVANATSSSNSTNATQASVWDSPDFQYAKLWSNVDIWVGFALGMYSPMRYFSGAHDCFGTWFEATMSISNFHSYFDKDYDKLPQLMVLSLVSVSYKLWKTAFVCVNQFDDQEQAGWYSSYSTSTLKLETDLNDHSTFGKVEQLVNTGIAAWNVKGSKDTNYFFFKKGVQMGNFIGQSVLLVNDFVDMNWMYASKPWIRFLSLV